MIDKEDAVEKGFYYRRFVMLDIMSNKPDVTIIIPAYNEERGITNVITQLEELSGNYEILVVDDGSTDNTYKLAQETGVKVIRHPYNKGYGAALKTGIRNATADVVLFMDADGQHKPKDIKYIEKQKGDVKEFRYMEIREVKKKE